MAKEVTGAIGIHRQFTKQPERTYQSNLLPLKAFSSYESVGGKGVELAKALSGLGVSYGNYKAEKEKALEYQAHLYHNQLTSFDNESTHKKEASLILNDLGLAHLIDNKYAVAAIEEERGKRFSAITDAQYKELIAQEGQLQTPEAEAERYTNFRKDKLKEIQDGITFRYNDYAFLNGYTANQASALLQNIQTQSDAKTKDLETERFTSTTSKISDIAYRYSLKSQVSIEDFKKDIDAFSEHIEISGYTAADRLKMWEALTENIAKETGSAMAVDAIGEKEVFMNGKYTKLKDHLDINGYKNIASQALPMKLNKFDMDITAKIEEFIRNGDKEGLLKYAEELREKDPYLFKTHEKDFRRGGELADKNKYELERQRQQQLMSGIQNQGNFDVAREYVRRALSGQFVPKSSTLGISQQNLDMAIEEAWTQLEGDGNKDQVTKNRELTYLLACFPESTRANAVKRRTNLDLDTLSSGDLLKKFRDTAGLGNINYAVNLYRANKAQAGTVLGSDVCSKLAGLTALLDIYGNEEQAIDLYVQAHHKLEEDGGRYKTQYEKAFSESASGWDFRIDDYTGKRTQRTYYHNSDDSFIDKIARTQYSYLRATGASNNSAMQGVQETLQNNFFMYRGHLLPNGFFDYLSVSDNTPQGKINNGTWILDKMIEKEQAAHSDWNGDWYVVYDDYYGTINIKCTGHEWSSNKSYTIQEFTDAVNNYSDDHPYSPPAPTFIDTIKAKETVGHHFNKQGRFWLPDYN